MRLIGMGLLAFLFAALAIAMTQSGPLRAGARALLERVAPHPLRFETARPDPKRAAWTRHRARRSGPATPILLSGLPAYQGLTFLLPVDAPAQTGVLQIDATMQVLSGVEAVLRVSIGNTRRAELLLQPGLATRSLRIELLPEDLSGARLDVSLSVLGEGPNGPCRTEEGLDVVIEIEPTSHLILGLPAGPPTIRDAALLAGGAAALGWSGAAQDRAEALRLGAALIRAGYEVGFARDGLPAKAASTLLQTPLHSEHAPDLAWANAFGPKRAISGVRRFERTHTWRVRYDYTKAKDPRLPAQMRLAMRLGRPAPGAAWQVAVTLNGRLLHQDLTGGGAYAATIEIPSDVHTRRNALEVTIISSLQQETRCARHPESFAEILPETVLIPGAARFSDPIFELRARIAASADRALRIDPLSPTEARAASRLLAELSLTERSQTAAARADLRVVARGQPLLATEDPVWLLREVDGALEVLPLADYAWPEAREVLILVSFSDTGT